MWGKQSKPNTATIYNCQLNFDFHTHHLLAPWTRVLVGGRVLARKAANSKNVYRQSNDWQHDVFENHVGSICLRMALTKISGSSKENFPGAQEMLQETKIQETPRGISIKPLKRIRRDFGDKKDLKRIKTKTYTSQYLVLSRNTNQNVNMTTRQNEQSSQHIW